jgi:putative YphP/YqiW family bacilliredoxin
MYPPELVKPMKEELTRLGVTELLTGDAARQALEGNRGTALLVVNSVCGCAAGNARPAVAMALRNEKVPDNLYTVFAGVDGEATAVARSYIHGYPPSSPAIALFRDRELVLLLERKDIEGRMAQDVAYDLVTAFDAHCGAGAPRA